MKKQRGQTVTDKIIDTAEKLFYNQGYNLTGINQVIAEADIAKASLYKHFESKADLLLAYIQRFHQEWLERIEARINKEPDPKQKLLTIFDHMSERQLSREYQGCAFVKANNEAGQNDERVLAEIQNAKRDFKALIEKLVINSGHKKMLTDQELTEMIFLMTEGGIVAASIFKQGEDLQSAKKIIEKLI
ncbi:TetR/AcrR family transcriptional regulator [Chryseobacterium polytrichastri]|uniref:Transcriptional regulator, TetR family n=1 Tax=Chryseobacterium polytrichastri TaxID=1302687 RepID=A0A1M6XH69_9FLAO|nr:TetR/AcrR family transcriptional regulator [Chryseobacterium polytrichastri]SHL05248.1 transcriptional regulator, TetR family [Chryseobacterium polytrichastri]